MRRALLLVALLAVVALLVWWALGGDPAPRDAAGSRVATTGEPDPEADAEGPHRRARARAGDGETADDPSVPAFLHALREIGQDREQDPALGAIRGRVLIAAGVPATTFAVEAVLRTNVEARARVFARSDFLLKNVPPGGGIALVVRAEDFAPGGTDKLIVRAGETLDVGTIYVGSALDPTVDNSVDVEVVAAGAPVKGALVTVSSVSFRTLLALGNLERQPGATIVRAETDEQGRARFEKLPPSRYDVTVEAAGFAFDYREGQLLQRATKDSLRFDLRPGLTIEGRAVREDQSPVAGARVVCLRFGGAFPMMPPAITGPDGAFSVKGLASGSHVVVVAKEDVGGKEVQGVAAGTKDLVVVVPAGAELWVRCTDAATGEPVREFGVRPIRKTPFAYLFSPLFEAKTEDGVYRLKMLPTADYGIEVSAQGYALATIAKVTLPCTAPIEVALSPEGVIRGRVVGKTSGTPIVGAAVYLKREGFPPSRAKDQQTVSDAKGAFVLGHLPATPVSVTIAHVDHDEATFESVTPAVGAASAEARDFPLGEGARIAGRVTRAGGTPSAGERVSLSEGFNFAAGRSTTTAADGSYSFANVPPGDKYTISVGAGAGRSAQSKRDVRAVEGETTTVDFSASGGQRLAGRVLRDEKPAGAVNVSVIAAEGASFSGSARSGDDGAFAVEGVPPGRYVVQASGPQGSRVVEVSVVEGVPPAEVVIVLTSGSIAGRVIDATTGQPLAAAWCACVRVVAAGEGGLADLVRGGNQQRTTGNDGAFQFSQLEEGTWRVRAFRDGYGIEFSEDVTIVGSETRDGVTIQVVPACTVEGVVRDAAGVPVAAVSIRARDVRGRELFPVSLYASSADGTFLVAALRPGTYELTAERDGWAPATRSVAVASAERAERVDFTLLQGGRIEVVVLDGEQKPVAGASVSLYDAAGQRVSRGLTSRSIFSTNANTTGADGRVVLAGVAAGTYEVRAGRPGAETVRRPGIVVAEGAPTPVEVALPAEPK